MSAGCLGFAPWQHGLAFAAPCVGGLVGSRLARWLVARFGQHKVMLAAGTLRACMTGPRAAIVIAGLLLLGTPLLLPRHDGVSLLAGAPHGHGRGRLAERPGQAAEGPAPAGSVALSFQPGDGREADLGLTGQRRLRQAALAAQLP